MFDGFGRHDWCSVFGIEDWQWHTPSPLTRDNPVTTVTNHIVETYFAPFRMEFNLFNFVQNFLTEFRNRCKPLWYCPPDDWLLSTPVKWIRVRDFFLSKEQVTKLFNNCWCNLVIELACKVRTSIFHHDTALINSDKYFQAISYTDIIVVLTKTRRCMDNTGTRVCRNVVTKDNKFIYSGIPWVNCYDVVQFLTTVGSQNLNISPSKFLRQTIQQF